MSQSRLRVSGVLTRASRGLMLTSVEDELWVLETQDDVEKLIGKAVMVEGTKVGFDRLQADWIGAV